MTQEKKKQNIKNLIGNNLTACVIYPLVIICMGAVAFNVACSVRDDDAVEKYRSKLPNYADTLAAFDKKYADSTIAWENAIKHPNCSAQRDGTALKLGYHHAQRSEIIDKQRIVNRQVLNYRDSLYARHRVR